MWRGRNDKEDGRDPSVLGPTDGTAAGPPDLRHASPEDLRNDIRSGKIRRIGGTGAEPTFSTTGDGSFTPAGVDGPAELYGDDVDPSLLDLPSQDRDEGDRPGAAGPGPADPAGWSGNGRHRNVPLAAVDRTGHQSPRSDHQSRDLGVFTNVTSQDRGSGSIEPPTAAMGPLRPVGPDGPDQPEDPRFGDGEPLRGGPPHPADAGFGPGPSRGGLRAVDSPPGANPDPWGTADDTPWATGDETWSGSWSTRGPDGDDGGRPQPPKLELAPPVESRTGRGPLFALGALAVLLGLGALYYFVIRGDDSQAENGNIAADETEGAGESTDGSAGQGADAGSDTDAVAMGEEPAGPTSLDPNPVLSLEGADSGPLETETAYPTFLEGAPVDSEYMVIVDGREQGEPIDYLPDLVLPEGRHSIVMEVVYQGETATTNPVEVYVLAPDPTAGYRANLSSVSVLEQGWGEALRQFDEFRAAGHEQLQLSPSDPYPSLLPGYWNIYVDGFASREEASAYCEGSGLSIPDQCFPSPFDPDAPARED